MSVKGFRNNVYTKYSLNILCTSYKNIMFFVKISNGRQTENRPLFIHIYMHLFSLFVTSRISLWNIGIQFRNHPVYKAIIQMSCFCKTIKWGGGGGTWMGMTSSSQTFNNKRSFFVFLSTISGVCFLLPTPYCGCLK